MEEETARADCLVLKLRAEPSLPSCFPMAQARVRDLVARGNACCRPLAQSVLTGTGCMPQGPKLRRFIGRETRVTAQWHAKLLHNASSCIVCKSATWFKT